MDIEYINEKGVAVTIRSIGLHGWYGKMTGHHYERYPEYRVLQDGALLMDGFDTLEEAKRYADRLEY